MLSGFELYSCWVPLSPRGFKTEKASLSALRSFTQNYFCSFIASIRTQILKSIYRNEIKKIMNKEGRKVLMFNNGQQGINQSIMGLPWPPWSLWKLSMEKKKPLKPSNISFLISIQDHFPVTMFTD